MGITQTQLKELIAITMQSFPKPPVVDLLCGVFNDDETDILINFLKENYTEEEVLAGIEEHTKRCNFIFELYGKK